MFNLFFGFLLNDFSKLFYFKTFPIFINTFRNEKKKTNVQDTTHITDSYNPIRPSTIADFSIPNYASGNPLVFCLIATINAEGFLKKIQFLILFIRLSTCSCN